MAKLKTLGFRVQPVAPRITPSGGANAERIRGRQLQRIREYHFRQHPLCVACEAAGIVRAATELDHIVALVNGGRDEQGNRQGLCAACHAAKTRADLAQAGGG